MSEVSPFDCHQLSAGIADSYVSYVRVATGEVKPKFFVRGSSDSSRIMADMFGEFLNEIRESSKLVEASQKAFEEHEGFATARENFAHVSEMINMLDVEDPLSPEMEQLFNNLERMDALYEQLKAL